ncbi:MAG: spore germination protein [Desulfobacteraceae bacterium]|nr:spore germination protein [Desulfobacteraceae bacterium]
MPNEELPDLNRLYYGLKHGIKWGIIVAGILFGVLGFVMALFLFSLHLFGNPVFALFVIFPIVFCVICTLHHLEKYDIDKGSN